MVTVIFKQHKKAEHLKGQKEKECKISADENKNVTHGPLHLPSQLAEKV
ncbi:MAG: hypothetical protein ABIO55_11790 [Ginsengibacter sp.]